MQVDIQLVPSPPNSDALLNRTVVVVDVLRATSVMVNAISQGALEILPLAGVEEALQMAKVFPRGSVLLGGERESKSIPGFDLGNSPKEYVAESVKGKKLILTTTNGTKAFHLVSSGKEVLVGSFLNIGAVARRCLESGRELLIFLSGDEGGFSLEDTVCGGMLIGLITKKRKKSISLTDASRCAQILYQRFKNNLLEAFHLSYHGKQLINRGFEDDLDYCAQIDITSLVPVFREGVIRAPSSPPSPARGEGKGEGRYAMQIEENE
ncbi:MAG TPA: 2-phosphosulfolactate phosphatase [Thermodesulfobacteriota bacterium]|nr:2-phosphosulfolactate phosphatase [Thermodesulfobacteriota bacterium]